MARFVNRGAAVHLFKPAGDLDDLLVEHGQAIEVPGDVAAELGDAYVIGEGDNARAWPKAQWELEQAGGEGPRRDEDGGLRHGHG